MAKATSAAATVAHPAAPAAKPAQEAQAERQAQPPAIRQPLIVCVGHVDAGKTKLLDRIRGTAIAAKEAGGITQSIGCSHVPLATVKAICGELLDKLNIKFSIPGLLFIDTPGHAAFTSLRKRGGNLADIAILVIDINKGFQQQTLEAIDILRSFKTPFVVAANKTDLIPGWRTVTGHILADIESQAQQVRNELDIKLYETVGKLSELGFNSERFDRVEDYTNQIAIIPCAAKTGEGIAELLMVITGLAQRYLEASLRTTEGVAKGTVLEVKKDKGLGTTLDVIIYDGVLRKGDILVIGGLDKPVITKVKALFEPMPLQEMRDKAKFAPVDKVNAAAGVKISALNISEVVAGAPLQGVHSEKDKDAIEKAKAEIQTEVSEVLIETEKDGIVVKADTLGSLEALLRLLREKGIQVKRASIGEIGRKDILSAEANSAKSPLNAAVLGFNVRQSQDTEGTSGNVKVIMHDVIYKLIEDFAHWQEEAKKHSEAKELGSLMKPCRMRIMPGYVFRQSNPAIVGVEITAGTLTAGMPVMKDGKQIGTVKEIQLEQKSITTAEKGKQVAASIDGATVGRQINEGDELLSYINEDDFRALKKLAKLLEKEEIAVLKEIAELMRKDNPMWGV